LDPRLWIREPFLESDADFDGKIVVFGHTPQRTGEPLVLPNKIGLDTAAAYGGPLTAAALDPDSSSPAKFWQVWPG
jgi:serine/threonine protein phosphatase 1